MGSVVQSSPLANLAFLFKGFTVMSHTIMLLLPLLFAVFASVRSTSAASLYLHPAAPGRGRAADISPVQANHILAHLLDVPGETLGAAGSDRDAWDWIHPNANGKKAVEDLFTDSTERKIVLFTDLDKEDAQGELLLYEPSVVQCDRDRETEHCYHRCVPRPTPTHT
jgi:hypothetical protein